MILVYDVSNQPTFDCCPEWLREIEEYASPKVLKVLVGKSENITTQLYSGYRAYIQKLTTDGAESVLLVI